MYTAVCMDSGEWEPDFSTLECAEPGVHNHFTFFMILWCNLITVVKCNTPESRHDVTFNFSTTTEGSKMTITCNEGLYLREGKVEFFCNTNGSWTPDPAGQYCYGLEQESGKHTEHAADALGTSVQGLSCILPLGSPTVIASGVVGTVVVVVTTVAVSSIGIAVSLVLLWKRKLRSKAILQVTCHCETQLVLHVCP